MARMSGRGGAAYVSPTGTTEAVAIGGLTQWTLDRTADAIPVSAFGDLNKVYVQSHRDIRGTLSLFWDTTTDPLYVAGLSIDGTTLYLYPDRLTTPTTYHTGPAWLTTSIAVDVAGAVQTSARFIAKGQWWTLPSVSLDGDGWSQDGWMQ